MLNRAALSQRFAGSFGAGPFTREFLRLKLAAPDCEILAVLFSDLCCVHAEGPRGLLGLFGPPVRLCAGPPAID